MADAVNQTTSSLRSRFSGGFRAILNPPVTVGNDTKTKVAALLDIVIKIGMSAAVIVPIFLYPVAPSLTRIVAINAVLFGLGAILLWLNAHGYVRATGIGLMASVIGGLFADTILSGNSLSPSIGILIPIIAIAGFAFGYRGLIVASAACIGMIGTALLTQLMFTVSPQRQSTLLYDYGVHTAVILLSTVAFSTSVRFLRQAQLRERESETALAERNRDLEQEIIVRRQAEQKQEVMALSMREVIDAANELLSCEDMDTLWRRAVELARERLGLERCSIFLTDYATRQAIGTYGTDIHGRVCSEKNVSFTWSAEDIFWQQNAPARGMAEWVITPLTELHGYSGENGRNHSVVARGWNGKIAIRMRKGPAIATLFCDAAISGKDPDPSQLELVAVYCSLLGSIAERKQLTANVTARTRELAQLLDISQTISSTLEPNVLLEQLFVKLKAVINCDGILVSEFTNGYDSCIVACSDEIDREWVGYVNKLDPSKDAHIVELIATRRPLIIPDITADTPYAQGFLQRVQRAAGDVPPQIASVMYLPLVVRERIIGYMRLTSSIPNNFDGQNTPIALAFANQAAILMEVARAHHEGIKIAALKERSRIARELHDSVSQALFGIVLGVRTSMQHVQANSNPLASLEYTLTLSEAALGEIRALIFELRPEYLEKEGLIAALRKQTEALCKRYQIEVQMDVRTEEPNLPVAAKEAIYRIGLEALQNTLKHAQATHVTMVITQHNGVLHLEMKDNGKGFDLNADYGGHFGLFNMRERAAQFGARLNIDSQPNAGTRVNLQMPLP